MVSFSNPDGVHAPHGQYSHTATVPADTELVFVSGQVGVRPDGSTPGTMVEQPDQAFANVVALLRGTRAWTDRHRQAHDLRRRRPRYTGRARGQAEILRRAPAGFDGRVRRAADPPTLVHRGRSGGGPARAQSSRDLSVAPVGLRAGTRPGASVSTRPSAGGFVRIERATRER